LSPYYLLNLTINNITEFAIVANISFYGKINFMKCLFCKIIDQEIPAKIIYEDDKVVAFNDINPQAPVHILIIPRQHIATSNDLQPEHEELVGHIVTVAQKLAKQLEIAESGYRIVMNCNSDGGQAVYHLHLHLLGGRKLEWPPG
jgi:histidine triad (HIT) family protein